MIRDFIVEALLFQGDRLAKCLGVAGWILIGLLIMSVIGLVNTLK